MTHFTVIHQGFILVEEKPLHDCNGFCVLSGELHSDICQFVVLPTRGAAKKFLWVQKYTPAVQLQIRKKNFASAINFASVFVSTK